MAERALVHAFTNDHPGLSRLVRARLEKRRGELIEQLQYAQDWADYNRRVGRLAGTDDALQICLEVESELRK